MKIELLSKHKEHLSRRLLFLWSIVSLLTAQGNKQLSISPYYDSNVQESFNQPLSTSGLKIGGRYEKNFGRKQFNTFTRIQGQTYLDTRYFTESKFLLLADLDHYYRISRKTALRFQWNYFHKVYFDPTRFYRWGDGGLFVQYSPTDSFSGKAGFRYRRSAVSSGETNRFQQQAFEFLGRYTPSSHLYVEVFGGPTSVIHRDFKALAVVRDTVLTVLSKTQQDDGRHGGIHFRYQGKIIYGAHVNYESVTSNSVIGNYSILSLRLYLSGQWRQNTFYHIVIQQMDKAYKNESVQGVSGYRDPEELIQNRSYFRLEHQLKPDLRHYVQLSVLQNETLLNQQYYDKIILEAGLKFEF
ncbi:MAG: hypothetical protein ISR82_05530 [Candidatus Marinimicrobia bacterium]|nr:hypothetical protein [Candidatus Neomarinimicrobiota bacterium]MBL7010663.1 hypothetical protein [Candidatus Neomarinimicrobiota bacterium]MBL7030538.1 hypothetical protein [Candidatus Neomarinimicrobiota bacterium]